MFAAGKDVSVNLILGLTFIKATRSIIDLGKMGSLNPNLTILNLGASPSNELYFQSPKLQLQKFLSIEKIIPLSLPTWPQSKQSL